jgi:hypothetical protein
MFVLASRLLDDDVAALCAAAFFGFHSAFEWISQWTCLVQSALMLIFVLGAVLASFREDAYRWLAAPLVLAALLTREAAIVLPALIVVLAVNRRTSSERRSLPRLLLRSLSSLTGFSERSRVRRQLHRAPTEPCYEGMSSATSAALPR